MGAFAWASFAVALIILAFRRYNDKYNANYNGKPIVYFDLVVWGFLILSVILMVVWYKTIPLVLPS